MFWPRELAPLVGVVVGLPVWVPLVRPVVGEADPPVWAMAVAAKMAMTAAARILKFGLGFLGCGLKVDVWKVWINECSWKLEVFKVASWM